jgi:hypothetical protein
VKNWAAYDASLRQRGSLTVWFTQEAIMAWRAAPRTTVVFAAGDPDGADMTTNDVDDASQLDPLLDQVEGPVASFTGDGAYDQDNIYRTVIDCDPDAAVVVPPRATAVLSETAETGPTQRDRHLQCIAERGRMGW